MKRLNCIFFALLVILFMHCAISGAHEDHEHGDEEDHHEEEEEELLNANILQYMKGAKLRDYYGNLTTPILEMKFGLLSGTLGEITGEVGEYIFNLPYTDIRIMNAAGKMTGTIEISAKLTAKSGFLRNKKIDLDVKGTYIIMTKGANVNITANVPDITKDNLTIEGCNATFAESSIMLEIKKKDGKPNLVESFSRWVDRALKPYIPEIFCNAVEDEVKKGNKSKVVKSALAQIIAVILGG
ncbi:uncharacterized protein LOC120326823 [Styela clava]